MRLYGAIQKVEPQDDGTVRVYGIASSEAVDDQGEIVRADAMRAAIPEYMRFPALREMHQLSAAGTTLEAEVNEDGTTRIVAHVVDPVAVAKVKNQVYRGFSIGGRVLQRETGNSKTITGLLLSEISLVDRPANPEAVFDCWKAAAASVVPLEELDFPASAAVSTTSAQSSGEQEPFHPPIQIWACGVTDHRHVAKADALKCLDRRATASVDAKAGVTTAPPAMGKGESRASTAENDNPVKEIRSVEPGNSDSDVQYAGPGFQPDRKKRYAIDTGRHIRAAGSFINNPDNQKNYTGDQLKRIRAAIIAAWRKKIDKDGPPSVDDREKAACAAPTKTLWDVGHVARVILDLDWLMEALDLEAAIENDNSPQPARLQEIIAELGEFLNGLVTEETGEILADVGTDSVSLRPTAPGMVTRAGREARIPSVDSLKQNGRPSMRKLAARVLAKAKHSQGDQALLDMARFACDRCLKMGDLSVTQGDNLEKARDHLDRAGALTQDLAPDMTVDVGDLLPAPISLLGVSAEMVGKARRAQQYMMDMAHECLKELTDATICDEAAKVGARHSSETMEHLMAAHRHLVVAGVKCDGANFSGSKALPEDAQMDGGEASRKAARVENLAKALTVEHTEKMALGKVLGEIVPMLERLTERVDEIARTPLPPLTIAKGTVSISKQQDHGSGSGGEPQPSPETIASALAKMSKEEQTLTLIKASYANPIRVHGSAADDR